MNDARVLLVGSRNLGESGGELRLVANRATAMWRKSGIRTHALVVRPGGRSVPASRPGPGLEVETIVARGGGWPAALLRLARRAYRLSREPGWAGVIVSGIGGYALVPVLARWFAGLPMVADIHGAREEWLEYPPARLARFRLVRPAYAMTRALERSALGRCDAALVVSDELAGHLRASYGPLRTLRVPCGVPRAIMTTAAAADRRARTRARLGLTGRTTFVFCGRLSGWQCFRESVELWQAWREREPRAALLVVTPDRGPALAELRRRPGRFIVTQARPEEVAGLLPAADFGLMLRQANITNHVAFPNKFAEYVQAGLAVVTSPGLTGPARLVREFELGVLVEPGAAARPGSGFVQELAALACRRSNDWSGWYTRAQQAVAQFGDIDAASDELARFFLDYRPAARGLAVPGVAGAK